MPKITQLTVTCENRPGTLAELTRILSSAKVSILALNAGSAGAMAYVQIVVTNSNKAKKALKTKKVPYYEERVLHVKLPNVPGALSDFAAKVAAKGVNIGAAYHTAVEGAKEASWVLAVSHLGIADRIRREAPRA
jgi:hypothetical protein